MIEKSRSRARFLSWGVDWGEEGGTEVLSDLILFALCTQLFEDDNLLPSTGGAILPKKGTTVFLESF